MKTIALHLLLCCLMGIHCKAQRWKDFDNEWISVTLDTNVSLQFPHKALKIFEINDLNTKGIGTKKNLTYYYAKCINKDSVSADIDHIQDSLIIQAKYTVEAAYDTMQQILYRSYIQQLANMYQTNIYHLDEGTDGVPGYKLLFIQPVFRVYAKARQSIFYSNNKLYVIEMLYSVDADDKTIAKIWKKYSTSVHVKNKN